MDGFEVIVKAGEETRANSVDLRGMDADEIDRVITLMGADVMRTIPDELLEIDGVVRSVRGSGR